MIQKFITNMAEHLADQLMEHIADAERRGLEAEAGVSGPVLGY